MDYIEFIQLQLRSHFFWRVTSACNNSWQYNPHGHENAKINAQDLLEVANLRRAEVLPGLFPHYFRAVAW
ncbi:hypothetical protein RGU77_16835 [Actimicrobium sp. CCI2.3]|uniref:hypothetical protein n=1 Tax=Actimicrobium sp. CCI2.3 TaxID=3048616 RepID=UPI002AB4F1E4|nr:hypothetical protein [Actimicrobium sp. CCI2.3]MDY7575933.1 hypothetical protein [Actimicrobium sp. CCI2.3]